MKDAEDRFRRLLDREMVSDGPDDYGDPFWRLTELEIFECQYGNGGLQGWYSNPCGEVWRETTLALHNIGLTELAQSLTTMCERLEEVLGVRRHPTPAQISDGDLEKIRELTKPYELLPERYLEDGSFYTKACDWWEGVLARGETKRTPR